MSVSLLKELGDLAEFIFFGGGVILPLDYSELVSSYVRDAYRERGEVPIVLKGNRYHKRRLQRELDRAIPGNKIRVEFKETISDKELGELERTSYLIETEYFQNIEANKELFIAERELKQKEEAYSEFLRRNFSTESVRTADQVRREKPAVIEKLLIPINAYA